MVNKTALITGAAKRIGAAIAKHLHESGMNIIVHYNTSAKEAQKLIDELNSIRSESAIAVQADLEKKESYPTLIDSALKFNGNIDVLINNASAFYPTPLDKLHDDQWEEMININLKAPLFLSQLAATTLRKNKGCIINIADIHANKPLAEHAIYSVSKAGLIMLTQSLAKELAPDIRVNAISPGAITWPANLDKLEDVSVTGVNITEKNINEEQTEASVKIVVKYYLKSEGSVKTLKLEQEWWFSEQNKQWFIDGEFPIF